MAKPHIYVVQLDLKFQKLLDVFHSSSDEEAIKKIEEWLGGKVNSHCYVRINCQDGIFDVEIENRTMKEVEGFSKMNCTYHKKNPWFE